MAKYEAEINGDFYDVVRTVENGIIEGNISASLEDESNFVTSNTKCAIRVFERYSYTGNNRVSLSVTLFCENNGPVYISAITSGGSQAVFFKLNTFGEESFLKKFVKLIESHFMPLSH